MTLSPTSVVPAVLTSCDYAASTESLCLTPSTTCLLPVLRTACDTACAATHLWPVYESEEYYRASVAPQLEDGSSIPADVYIWKEQYK